MTSESWVFPATVKAGTDEVETELHVRVEFSRADPDVGFLRDGYVIDSATLELSGDLLLMIGSNVEEQFTVNIAGRDVPLSFDVLNLSEPGHIKIESVALDTEIADNLTSIHQTMKEYRT